MCDEKSEKPIVLNIDEIINEGENLKTFIFNYPLNAKPGQFIMLWYPGVGLKPFSISSQSKNKFGITIFAIGDFTKKLLLLKKGDLLGIQGPYGSSYSTNEDNVALVGGGCGTASLALLADELIAQGKKVHFIIGAKTKSGLLYQKRFGNKKINLIPCTDDGSSGFKGFTTQALVDILKREKISKVYTCGPEIMMKKVINACDEFEVDCEVSMERYMKCGFGVCGQCVVDGLGIRICKEGPILSKEIVKKIPDFGYYKRDASGKKINYSSVCKI